MNQEILLQNRKVGANHPPFIIAEISGNHNQSKQLALDLIDALSETGVDAIKFQTYTADTITLNSMKKDFVIQDPKSLWSGRNLYDLYKEAHTPWEWHAELFSRCKKNGVLAFSSAFDETAVDFLETFQVPCYKVASFESTHHPLLKKVASTGKPIILSTGLASLADIDESVKVLRNAGVENLILLKCTSSYPASPKASNLKTIQHMHQAFQCQVGLSDHTLGIGAAVAACALGATVIEKHVTLSRKDGGVDSAFSLEPDEVKTMVQECRRAWESVGQIFYGPTETETNSLQFRRSIYFCQNAKKGDTITASNIRIVRPGHGLEPKFFESVLGKKINQDVEAGTALSWLMVE